MTKYISAGSYANELDFSNYVTRVAGASFGIVGTAGKGPTNVPTLLTNAGQAKQIFGFPLPTANRSNYGLHAAFNALNQTGSVWFTRVTDGSERAASGTSSIIINDQIVFLADDSEGISVTGGKLAITLQISKKTGSVIGSDAYAGLVRRFGVRNIFDSTYVAIDNAADFSAAVEGTGAFINVSVPMATATKLFSTAEQFVSRFNAVVSNGVLRADIKEVVESGATVKYVVIKTQALSEHLAQNLEFVIVEDVVGSPVQDDGFASAVYNGGNDNSKILLTAKNPGLAGNGISLVVEDGGAGYAIPVVTVSGRTITVKLSNTTTKASDVIAALDNNNLARNLVTAGNDGASTGAAVVSTHTTSVLSGGGTNLPSKLKNPTIGTSNHSTSKTQVYSSSTLTLKFSAKSAGSFANKAVISFGKDSSGLATIEYKERDNQTVEKVVGVVVQPAGTVNSFLDYLSDFDNVAAPIAADITLLTDSASKTKALGTIDSITEVAGKEWLTWNAYEFNDVKPVVINGGRDGIPDDYADLADAVIGNSADKTGLYSFANRDSYDNFYLVAPGFDQPAVIRAGLSIAETAGDMVYIVDGPGSTILSAGLSAQEIVDWHNGKALGNTSAFNSSYGVLYHTWQKTRDSYNGGDIFVPPSVLLCEQFAYSENVGEKWFAKAGLRRGRLLRSQGGQSACECNQGERDYMYGNGNAVNAIANFQREGSVIWGQRTLQRNASALDRLNVRDLLNYLKRTSTAATRVDLFEPNDPTLWRSIVSKLNPVYAEVKQKRGLNRFEIKIDAQTTTKAAQNNNEVIGYVLVEPTKTGEKLILNYVITATGASFTEALAAAGVV